MTDKYFLHYLTWHLFEYVLLSFKNPKMHVANRLKYFHVIVSTWYSIIMKEVAMIVDWNI